MPGTLINPTSVAATSCQALSPGLSQESYGVIDQDNLSVFPSRSNHPQAKNDALNVSTQMFLCDTAGLNLDFRMHF
jgi:hypothetical protein